MVLSAVLPVFSTVIINFTISPAFVSPSPLSIISYVFVASTLASALIKVIVGSSVVLPSVSSPSSLVSDTLPVNPFAFATALRLLDT